MLSLDFYTQLWFHVTLQVTPITIPTERMHVLVWEFQSGHPLLWAKQHT